MPMAGDYLRRAAAEFIGTFALVFIAAGSLIYGDVTGAALAYGLVVAVMVSAVGHISGGHFNPAVTLGFLVTRRITVPPRFASCRLPSQLPLRANRGLCRFADSPASRQNRCCPQP